MNYNNCECCSDTKFQKAQARSNTYMLGLASDLVPTVQDQFCYTMLEAFFHWRLSELP